MRHIASLIILFFSLVSAVCFAGENLPPQARQYKRLLIRVAHASPWGLTAPVAVFAGQIHAESAWNPRAKSPVGAMGLCQFMPKTAQWWSKRAGLGEAAPFLPSWSMQAMLGYDHWLYSRVDGHSACHKIAFALSAYNGGLGWVYRDKRLAKDNRDYWGSVAGVNAGRCEAAFRENRAYPIRILHKYAPIYHDAGWGRSLCGP